MLISSIYQPLVIRPPHDGAHTGRENNKHQLLTQRERDVGVLVVHGVFLTLRNIVVIRDGGKRVLLTRRAYIITHTMPSTVKMTH